MGGLDAPGLRIEVVGTVADIFHWAESGAFIGDGNDTTSCVGRQHEGFTAQIAESFGVRKVDVWEFTLGKVCFKHLQSL